MSAFFRTICRGDAHGLEEGERDDSQLQHVVELVAGNTQTLRRQAAGTGMDGQASGGEVVLNEVFD